MWYPPFGEKSTSYIQEVASYCLGTDAKNRYISDMKSIESYEQLRELVAREKALMLYFSTPTCGVCKSIKPKIIDLVAEDFPEMGLYYVDTESIPEARGQLSIYSVPAILVFFEGKELIREARNFGILDLGRKIDRFYGLLFTDEPAASAG